MLLLIFRGSRTPPPPPPPPPPGIDPLSPQYLGRPNVYFKLGFGRRKEERPPSPPPVQRAKPSALLLGLVGRIEAPLPVKPAAAALLAPQIEVPAKPKRKAKPTIVLPPEPPAPKPQAPEPPPVDTSQAELRAALREELNAAADEARARLALRRDLTAELHGFAEAMALRLDLERELRDAQKWAEGRIKRRRRQRAAALAVMLLSE